MTKGKKENYSRRENIRGTLPKGKKTRDSRIKVYWESIKPSHSKKVSVWHKLNKNSEKFKKLVSGAGPNICRKYIPWGLPQGRDHQCGNCARSSRKATTVQIKRIKE